MHLFVAHVWFYWGGCFRNWLLLN